MDKKKRFALQSLAALLQNANFKGFFTGRIYGGRLKNICVPGLNCYSCPGAAGACPIGALQNALSARHFKVPYYVVGLLLFFGALLGRAVCGFLCPFGFLQDLLHRIPFPKKLRTFKGDKPLRKLKYLVLLFAVLLLPTVCKLTPVFCKYICPSGTLSGILLTLSDSRLVSLLGGRFLWKCSILCLVILSGIVLFRPFCKYLCPLGAVYALFNRVSVVQMQVDAQKCTHCGACKSVCGMCVDPAETPNHTECIRCGKCIECCPHDALSYANLFQKEKQQSDR